MGKRVDGMTSTAPLIGLGGALAAGKDALADRLVAKFGYVKLGMSDTLVEHASRLDPWIFVSEEEGYLLSLDSSFYRFTELLEWLPYVEAKRIADFRAFLQKDGTEGGRDFFGENVWADRMALKIDEHRNDGRPVVVTGIRFQNELQMIHELGGWSTWIDRPMAGHEGTPGHDMNITKHVSENSVRGSEFMISIRNDGSLESLYEKADSLARDVQVW